jgi:hypothetical protein
MFMVYIDLNEKRRVEQTNILRFTAKFEEHILSVRPISLTETPYAF